ncbi:hypothetical protein T484DRAFT_1812802 [Baffinella frigidus]|nr:hypothetical protein T484DRAFT_1812802 [Cryptophyta sp. CCMP2293]
MGGPSYLSLGASKKAPPSPSSSRRPGGRVKAGKEKEINLSAMLRQCPSAVEPNKISVVEKYITQIDAVPDRFLDAEILFLSHNSLSTLAGFRQFRKLRVLSLAFNCLENFSEIESLSEFPHLQVLNLDGNPVTVYPHYRLHVIQRLPKLKTLDNKEVKPKEREMCGRVLREEQELLGIMFSNHLLHHKLQALMHRVRLHSELMAVTFGRVSALNRAELPTLAPIDTRRCLEYWDFESHIGTQERDRVLHLIKDQVRRTKLEAEAKHAAVGGAHDVFRELLLDGDDANASTASKRAGATPSEHQLWEVAYKTAMLAQQTRLSRGMSQLQEVRASAEERAKAMAAQCGAIQHLRADSEDKERRSVLEREALIRDLRDQVGALEQATGMTVASLSPVFRKSLAMPNNAFGPGEGGGGGGRVGGGSGGGGGGGQPAASRGLNFFAPEPSPIRPTSSGGRPGGSNPKP